MRIDAMCMDCLRKKIGFMAELEYEESDTVATCSYCKELKPEVMRKPKNRNNPKEKEKI